MDWYQFGLFFWWWRHVQEHLEERETIDCRKKVQAKGLQLVVKSRVTEWRDGGGGWWVSVWNRLVWNEANQCISSVYTEMDWVVGLQSPPPHDVWLLSSRLSNRVCVPFSCLSPHFNCNHRWIGLISIVISVFQALIYYCTRRQHILYHRNSGTAEIARCPSLNRRSSSFTYFFLYSERGGHGSCMLLSHVYFFNSDLCKIGSLFSSLLYSSTTSNNIWQVLAFV